MDRPIRLMTANLLGGHTDRESLAGLLDRVEPDILLAQEMGDEEAAVIAPRFLHHDLRPDTHARGRGIASRLNTTFGEIPLPWRPGLWAAVEVGPQSLLVANIHMRNPVSFPPWRSVPIRGRQVDALFEWADGAVELDKPFILAGDMNASPAWPIYKRLAGRWDDLVARSAELAGSEPVPTWAWRWGWPRMLRIDHVFGSGARVESTTVEPLRGSDHAAVVVDLVLD